jgi:hypothetical protein
MPQEWCSTMSLIGSAMHELGPSDRYLPGW